MKIALLSDYYPPHNPGGSEWGVYYLSQSLKKRDIENIIITPNYGTKEKEMMDGIKVIRFPMYKKAKNYRQVINPIWQNNLFFFLWSAFWIVNYSRKEKIDILHVHGKFLIPGAVIASWLLGIPVLVTIRDKQLICTYGKCFYENGRFKACNFLEYITSDFPWYYNHYVKNKNVYTFLYNLAAAIWIRIAHRFIKEFATHATRLITISRNQKKYMEINGFKNVHVIYNSIVFPKSVASKKRKGVLYAGKLSRGKGIYFLLRSIPKVLKERKEKFYFAGSIDEEQTIKKEVKRLKISRYVKFLGGIEHKTLRKLYQKSKLVVMPSTYPESFGRVALEALSFGTPVVVSNMGGLPEIVEDKVTGRIVNINEDELAGAIIDVLNNLDFYLKSIANNFKKLKDRFEFKPTEEHIYLYKHLISK